LQLCALVSGIRKSFAFGSTAVSFPARGSWVLSREIWGFNHERLRLLTCGGMLGRHGGNSWQGLGGLPSNNSFKPKPLRSSKNHGK
jgi:hypothetical protein